MAGVDSLDGCASRRPNALRRSGAPLLVALVGALSACGGSGDDGTRVPAKDATPASRDRAVGDAAPEQGSIAFRRWMGPDRTLGVIFTIAPDGSGERQVSKPGDSLSDDYPDFAADGRLIAFQRCGDERSCAVFTVRPDGAGERVVAGCDGRELPPDCARSAYPAISPDRREIAYVRTSGRVRGDGIDPQAIFTMRPDGSRARRVTLPRGLGAADGQPQWSPDGRQIVFVRERRTAELAQERAIFVVNADGSDASRVTPWEMQAGDGPNWSPDGSRILFRNPESDDFTNSNLYTVRPDGSKLTQITDFPPATRLYSSSFSPDGRSITFGMTGVDGEPDVYTMRLGGTPERVTRTPLADSAPDWGGSG